MDFCRERETAPRRALSTGSMAISILLIGLSQTPGQPADRPTTVRVSDDVVTRGQRVTVMGDGWRPGTRVSIAIESRTVGDAGVDEAGEFLTAVEVPRDIDVEVAQLTVTGTERLGSPSSYSVSLEIGRERPRGVWITIAGAALVVLVLLALTRSALRRRNLSPARREDLPANESESNR